MKKMKKILSLLLAVALMVSSVNMTVFAEETAGPSEGTTVSTQETAEESKAPAEETTTPPAEETTTPPAEETTTPPAGETTEHSEAYLAVLALYKALPDASVITEETTDEEKAAIAAQLEEAIAALEEELSDEDYQLFHEEQAELLLAVSDLMDALDGGKADYDNAAEVDGTPYATLAEAVAAAQSSKTVKLLKNVHLSSTLVISEDKNITLDLAGHAITVEEKTTDRHYYAIDNYGTFVLQDSVGGGSITVRGIENLGNGKMTIQGGEIIAQDTNGGAAIWNEANLAIEGGTFKTTHVGSSSDTYGPGCLNNSGTALITGGKFESVNKRTYAIISTGEIEITPAEGKTVVVAGAHGGLGVNSGTAVVNGGSFSSTEYYGLYVSNDGLGTDPMQAAVTVNGGTFTGLAYSVWIGSDYNNPVNSTIEINGGYFNKPLNAQECTREGAIAIKGGYFTANPTDYVDTTKYLIKNTEDAEYPYSVELRNETNSAAKIGDTLYATLAEAVAAAKPGDTVIMLQDFKNANLAANAGVNFSLKNGVTLDGAGHAIRGNASLYMATKAGEKSTVKNVTFQYIHNNSPASQSDCDWYGWENGKEGTKSAIYASGLKGTVNIIDCTFDNADWDAIQITPEEGCTINITGNTFSHSSTTDYSQLRYIHIQYTSGWFYVSATVNINGNSFYKTKNPNANEICNVGLWNVSSSGLNLTGNYFEYDPAENLIDTNSEITAGIEKLFPALSSADAATADLTPVSYIGEIAYLDLSVTPAAYYRSNTYATLQDAINSSATTIYLARDNDEAVTVPKGRTVTISPVEWKLNGAVTNNGTLTLNGPAQVVNNGTLLIKEGGTYDPAKITNSENGVVSISGGTFSAAPDSAWIALGYKVEGNEDGTYKVSKDTAVMTDEKAVAAGAVARSGSATSSSRKYYKTVQEGIQNGALHLLKNVTEDVTKNSIIDLYCDAYTFTGSLICPGKTLYIDNGTAILNNIECGTFYGGYSTDKAEITVKNGSAENIKVAKNANVTIEGGKYSGTITLTSGGTGSLTITGGNFVSDPAAYVDTTKYLVKNTAGEEYPYSVELRNETNSVARIGGTFYETLADALKAAQPGDTVKLLRDVTLKNTITITKSVVLDLNTFTIDMIADGGRMFKDDGTVNFEVKNGNLKNTDDKVFYWSKGGTLTLTGVTANADGARVVQMEGDADTLIIGQGTSIYGDDNVIYLKGEGEQTVKIYGNVTATAAKMDAIAVSQNAKGVPTIEVYDGATVSSVGGAAIQFGTSIKLTVSGGTLQGGYNAVEAGYWNDDDIWVCDDITVVDGSLVSGGNIEGRIDIAGSPKFITGGVFSVRPDTAYVVSGKAVLLNDDAATKANYAFKIGVPPAAVTVIEVTEGAPEVSKNDKLTGDKAAAAGDATKAITENDNKSSLLIVPADSSKDDISKQATDIATNNTVKTDDTSYQDEKGITQTKSILNAVQETKATGTGSGTGGAVQQSDVTIVVQTYTDVQVADIQLNAGNSTIIDTVTYDITPMAQKVATTNTIAAQAESDPTKIKTTGDDKNAVKIGKPEKLDVNEATWVTIPLPENFIDSTTGEKYNNGKEVYIKHVKEDGTTYTYKGTIVNGADFTTPESVYHVTFLNPHGFSSFTVSPTTATVASITRDGTTVYFDTLQDAVDYVANNETIEITKNIDSAYVATVNRTVTFFVSNTTYTFDPAVNIRAGYSVNMTYNSATGTFTATYVPSYPYYPVEDPSADFWNDVESAIKNAKPGQTVKVNAKDFDKMPWQVMEALRNSDGVTLVITWNGGKDITIPAAKALATGNAYYMLAELAALDFGTAAPAGPGTAPETETEPVETPTEEKEPVSEPSEGDTAETVEPTPEEEQERSGVGTAVVIGIGALILLVIIILFPMRKKRQQ